MVWESALCGAIANKMAVGSGHRGREADGDQQTRMGVGGYFTPAAATWRWSAATKGEAVSATRRP